MKKLWKKLLATTEKIRRKLEPNLYVDIYYISCTQDPRRYNFILMADNFTVVVVMQWFNCILHNYGMLCWYVRTWHINTFWHLVVWKFYFSLICTWHIIIHVIYYGIHCSNKKAVKTPNLNLFFLQIVLKFLVFFYLFIFIYI